MEKGVVLRGFSAVDSEGFPSLNDKKGTVLQEPGGQQLFASVFGKFRGGALNDDVMSMMNGFTVLRLFARMNILFNRE